LLCVGRRRVVRSFPTRRSSDLGKLVAGVCVVDVDGRRPTIGAVLVRNILRLVDYWPLFYVVGIIAAMTSPSRQRLGDRVARTLVDRKSTRLNSSHQIISYAVFC